MIGEKQLVTTMDTLLNDKIYYDLYALIERWHNFIEKCPAESITHTIGNMHFQANWNDLYISHASNDNVALHIFRIPDTVIHVTNSMDASVLKIQGNATSTDLCPYNEIHEQKDYDNFGWYVRNHILTDEIESELFQESTINSVYSLDQLQTIMNKARNLPLNDKESLTITDLFRYDMYHKHISNLLWGYTHDSIPRKYCKN